MKNSKVSSRGGCASGAKTQKEKVQVKIKNFLLLTCIFTFLLLPFDFAYAIRPLYTEDCWVTTAGKPAIETGGLLLSSRNDTGYKEIVTSLKYGLNKSVDISIDLPYFSAGSYSENYDGLSDGTFKIKYNPYNNNECEGVSFLLGYMVNTGDPNNANLSTSQHDITTMFIYSKDVGEFNYHLNFGYTFDDNPVRSDAEDFIIYNASVVKPLNETINVMAETQYNINLLTGSIVHEVAAGFNYTFNKNFILDAAFGCGLTEDSSSSNLAFGATFLFD
ncbi:MAG: transporter [bacterium]